MMRKEMPQPAIYQKTAGRYSKWWCKSHKREATYIRLTPRNTARQVKTVCDPDLGGILLPCDCVRLA